jgi:diguanylate cyclase (GGDEF)-like protein
VRRARYSIRISWRFALVLGVLLPALVAVTAAGIHGLDTGRQGAHSLYEDHLRGTLEVARLESALQEVHRTSLELLLEDEPAQRGRLRTELTSLRIPAVERALASVDALTSSDSHEQAAMQTINTSWARFVGVLADDLPTATTPASHVHVENEINDEFHRAVAAATSITAQETREADLAYRAALRDYDLSIELMLIAGLAGLLCSIATVVWLIRSVLPRTLAYSAFATQVGRGDYSGRLHAEGRDELAQLGRALDELADRRQAEATYDRNKLELIDALQLTESEHDAHRLLRRHLERVIPQSRVTVLNLDDDSQRIQGLAPVAADGGAPGSEVEITDPRACLAIRKARPHHGQGTAGERDLLPCPVCSLAGARTTCEPLIVSGEVIGSVLTEHPGPLSETDQRAIRDAVTQAAPVVGNLRNLAGAEMRAVTDGLTGLPNRRAITSAMQRMVTQSLRADTTLAVLMCDVDHFKQVNDQYGHARGDEVLRSIGTVLGGSLRTIDFAGRYGGEEFLVVLSDADADSARGTAERIRAAVAAIRLPDFDRQITLSVGIAVLPGNGRDATTLLAAADQALYLAKDNGRDRVEVFPGGLPDLTVTQPGGSGVVHLRSQSRAT